MESQSSLPPMLLFNLPALAIVRAAVRTARRLVVIPAASLLPEPPAAQLLGLLDPRGCGIAVRCPYTLDEFVERPFS